MSFIIKEEAVVKSWVKLRSCQYRISEDCARFVAGKEVMKLSYTCARVRSMQAIGSVLCIQQSPSSKPPPSYV